MFSTLIFASLLSVCLPGTAFAREPKTGFLDCTISAAAGTYHYQVFVPFNGTNTGSGRLSSSLQGSGGRGDDGVLQTDVGLGHAIGEISAAVPFVVVMPQCRKEKIWNDPEMEAQVFAALSESMKQFNGSSDRIYLIGLSRGGYGTWEFGAKHAGKFAALVVVCGGIRPLADMPELHLSLTTDPKIAVPYAETARLIGRTPVWIFDGSDDPSVPVEEARKMLASLRAENPDLHYTECAGLGHNSWDKAAEPDLVPWLLAHSLKNHPLN